MPDAKAASLTISERDFQEQVTALARVLGYSLIYHTHDSRRSASGFPDLVLVRTQGERTVLRFLELKSEKGRVSPAQQMWVDGLNAAGLMLGGWTLAGIFRPSQWDELVEWLR